MKNSRFISFPRTAPILTMGLVLLLAGCATNVNTYERADAQATPSYVADKRVITDNTLAGTFRVVSINQATVSGNLLKVQATVENLKNKLRTLNYKFEWVDQNGMAVDSPNETWKSIMLQGRETTTISTVAVSPRAVDFRLKFRE
ncbi:MAG: YcfL family protein [Cephaloticoccus sp.]|nr:YcfL family protein [Cephaloticoccus sp.]MCF7759476.1 YcfL family protein [Cephaloticoccus sp.]